MICRYGAGYGIVALHAAKLQLKTVDIFIIKKGLSLDSPFLHKHSIYAGLSYYLEASSTATAHATVAPTIGLLPMPIRPIIST